MHQRESIHPHPGPSEDNKYFLSNEGKIWKEGFSQFGVCLFVFFNFYWRIIALQYCAGFCHTSTWISHRYICVPTLWNLLPISHPIPPFPRALGWVPCVVQPIPTGYLFHVWQCICFHAALSTNPTLSFTHQVHESVFYVCISIAALRIVF